MFPLTLKAAVFVTKPIGPLYSDIHLFGHLRIRATLVLHINRNFRTYFECNAAAVQRSCKINELVHPISDGAQQRALIGSFILLFYFFYILSFLCFSRF